MDRSRALLAFSLYSSAPGSWVKERVEMSGWQVDPWSLLGLGTCRVRACSPFPPFPIPCSSERERKENREGDGEKEREQRDGGTPSAVARSAGFWRRSRARVVAVAGRVRRRASVAARLDASGSGIGAAGGGGVRSIARWRGVRWGGKAAGLGAEQGRNRRRRAARMATGSGAAWDSGSRHERDAAALVVAWGGPGCWRRGHVVGQQHGGGLAVLVASGVATASGRAPMAQFASGVTLRRALARARMRGW
jgi:hypothetical protein